MALTCLELNLSLGSRQGVTINDRGTKKGDCLIFLQEEVASSWLASNLFG